MAYQVDFFAGTEDKVLAAVGSKVKYPAYVFIRDDENSSTGRLAFVDQNNVLKLIRGENKKQVVNVTTLPSPTDGDVEVLYIMNGIVYVFDGQAYQPTYKDYTAELEALTERVSGLEERIEAIENAEHPSIDTSELKEKIEELNGKIASLEAEDGNIVELITNLETISQELTTKVVELEKDVEILANDAPTFVELE